MDNNYDVAFDALQEKYLADNAKFRRGDVVYYEYVYTKDNQQRVATSVGIVIGRVLTKREVKRGDKSYTTYDITYSIVHPHGSARVLECKMCSVSEYIFREYLKHAQQASE